MRPESDWSGVLMVVAFLIFVGWLGAIATNPSPPPQPAPSGVTR